MNQFKVLIVNLSIKQRISIGVAAVAVIGGLLLLSNWNRERDFKPLYSNLSQEDAAAVLAKVRESATDFRLGEGGSSVLVPSARVAETRLQLASAGIPKSGRIGFELFDKTNFGTSDFTEQINYHRALEGEMERTVMSMAEVEQARVHITLPKDSLFTESKQPAKASILLKLKPGAKLSAQNVAAICQLAASAVEGLAPEAVSVVDMRGNLLNRARKSASLDGSEPDDTLLDYKSKIERDLMAKINTTLEPLLGVEKFRAGVSVDCDFSSGEQSEETFDPTKSVMVSSQKTEDISGGNSAAGVPGTASNLPRPTSKPGGGSSGVARRTENVAYQSSRLVKKTKLPQGSVKRVSVSILLDQRLRFEGSGPKAKRIIEPPSPERIKSIRELVAGSIGFSADRGDQLVIESLPFESTLNSEPLQPLGPGAPASNLPPWLQNALKNTKLLIAGAVGAVVVLVLLFAGVFMLTRKKVQAEVVQVKAEIEAAAATKVDDAQKRIEEAERRMEAQLAENAAQRQLKDQEALEALRIPAIATKKAEILTKHINEEARKDPKVMAQIVRAWMGEGDDRQVIQNLAGQPSVMPGIRKAAILMVVLGEATSAEVLKQLDEDEVQELGREIARISGINSDQAEAILEEFYSMTMAHDYVLKGGMDYARKVLIGAFGPEHAKKLLDRVAKAVGSESANFDTLQKADPQQLAKFIHNEHPQTIALILSHLNASQAAGLLISLPVELRADVALRMANLDQISPEIISKIASIIAHKLKSLGEMSRESYGGVRAVSEMFNRLDSGTSKDVLDTIEQSDPNLVETIRHLMFVFDDLLLLGPEAVKEVLTKVDRKVLTIALKGTSEQLKTHFLSAMSQRGAEMLKEDMDSLGPIKIKEVEGAQQQIIAVVRQLESDGTISLKGTVGEQYVV